MKRFGLTALSLALAISGCAQNKGKDAQTSRLDNLEAGFSRFQEQQRARDADIDAKLRDIASRLDRLNSGQPPAQPGQGKALKAAPASATRPGRQPIVAGQIIPLAPQNGIAPQPVPAPAQPPRQPASQPAAQPLPPARPAQPMPPPAPQQTAQASPGSQALPGSPVQQAAPAPQPAATPLRPHVVTVNDIPRPGQPLAMSPAPQAQQPKQPVPLDTVRSGKGKPARQVSAPAVSGTLPSAPAAPAPQPLPAAAPPAPLPPAVPGASGGPVAQPPAADIQEQLLYTEALRSVSANRNDEGRKKFNDFLARYPSSSKTPEVLFWIGESYMGDKSYNQAVMSFKEVTTRFPKDPKAGESLFRIADAYERLGDKSNAVFHLKLLVDEHPNSEFVGKAKQKLKQLGQ
ncbi:MAG: tetratricopeptide repeat protein [Acidobacteriota bacterium]